jgi:hypothetical protein
MTEHSPVRIDVAADTQGVDRAVARLPLADRTTTLVVNGGTVNEPGWPTDDVAAALRAAVVELSMLPGPVIISGGTQAGLFAVLGQVIDETGFDGPVIAVAPPWADRRRPSHGARAPPHLRIASRCAVVGRRDPRTPQACPAVELERAGCRTDRRGRHPHRHGSAQPSRGGNPGHSASWHGKGNGRPCKSAKPNRRTHRRGRDRFRRSRRRHAQRASATARMNAGPKPNSETHGRPITPISSAEHVDHVNPARRCSFLGQLLVGSRGGPK